MERSKENTRVLRREEKIDNRPSLIYTLVKKNNRYIIREARVKRRAEKKTATELDQNRLQHIKHFCCAKYVLRTYSSHTQIQYCSTKIKEKLVVDYILVEKDNRNIIKDVSNS